MPAANTCSPFDKLGVRIYCLVLSLPKDKRIVNILSVQSEVVAKPGIGEAIARMLLPLADIVTPNAFELTQLAALPVRNPDEAGTAAAQLGRPLVVATSIPDGVGRIGALASTRNECWFASTPRCSARRGRPFRGALSDGKAFRPARGPVAHSDFGICLSHPLGQPRTRHAAFLSSLRLIRHSAICTALSAAPLRRLSVTTQSESPCSTVGSLRMRDT